MLNQVVLSKRDLLSEWEQFIKTGSINPVGLNPIINDSWRRSYNAGVDPYQDMPYVTYKNKPDMCSEKLSTLISISYPIVDQTYNIIKGSGFHLFLVDEHACLVECIPVTRTIIDNWSEDVLGTNAIGTAIITRQTVQINGVEHYCHALHGLTTSAVPIIDCEGNLYGALGLIGPVYEDHSHVLSTLLKAVDKMKDCLTIDELSHKYMSVSKSLNRIIDSVPDGVVVLNSIGIIESVNTEGERILGKKTLDLRGLHFYNLVDHPSENSYEDYPFNNMDCFLDNLNNKYHCETTIQMIKDEKDHIANVLIFIRNNICANINEYKHHSSKPGFNNIMGKSKKLLASINVARIAADNMSNILLQGESGTGKDIFAQAIHNESPRRNGPFVAINCGAIPHELVSSELFGYVDGAFSGARRGGAPGKFEAAKGGTLFLDEISDMPLESQVALLRVLQDRKVTRIGDFKEIPVDIRIICATNRNLYQEVAAGKFREDLYYRINVISVNIPPLRERPEDITLLTKYYLAGMGLSSEFIAKIINSPLMEDLVHYQWPGNVRELQNIIERLVCITDKKDSIRLSDLNLNIIADTCENCIIDCNEKKPYKHRKQQIIMLDEANQIKTLMEKHHGNVSQVAREMGYSRVTMYRKLKLYDI